MRLLARATAPEQRLLGGLSPGELRQGAAGRGDARGGRGRRRGRRADAVRRAVTLSGDLPEVAVAAVAGGRPALAGFRLRSAARSRRCSRRAAPDLAAALERTGPAAVEWKLDGVRVQVHRDGDDVPSSPAPSTTSPTALPEVVAAARSLRRARAPSSTAR